MKTIAEVKKVLDRGTDDMPVLVEVENHARNSGVFTIKQIEIKDIGAFGEPEKWVAVITLGCGN